MLFGTRASPQRQPCLDDQPCWCCTCQYLMRRRSRPFCQAGSGPRGQPRPSRILKTDFLKARKSALSEREVWTRLLHQQIIHDKSTASLIGTDTTGRILSRLCCHPYHAVQPFADCRYDHVGHRSTKCELCQTTWACQQRAGANFGARLEAHRSCHQKNKHSTTPCGA